jgi:hypothetical protein
MGIKSGVIWEIISASLRLKQSDKTPMKKPPVKNKWLFLKR